MATITVNGTTINPTNVWSNRVGRNVCGTTGRECHLVGTAGCNCYGSGWANACGSTTSGVGSGSGLGGTGNSGPAGGDGEGISTRE